jgi:hypothetical protein
VVAALFDGREPDSEAGAEPGEALGPHVERVAAAELAERRGLWPAIAAGCHPARDTGAAIEAAGFAIERCERFGFKAGSVQPSVPHILGVARRG